LGNLLALYFGFLSASNILLLKLLKQLFFSERLIVNLSLTNLVKVRSLCIELRNLYPSYIWIIDTECSTDARNTDKVSTRIN
jgi:hypothetical protein